MRNPFDLASPLPARLAWPSVLVKPSAPPDPSGPARKRITLPGRFDYC
jgi:hypothetical protein